MPKFIGELKGYNENYALMDSSNLRGGFMQLSTMTELQGLPQDKRKKGMIAYVEEAEQIYEWKGDKWVIFKVNSGVIAEKTDKVQFYTVSEITEGEAPSITNDDGITIKGLTFENISTFKDGDLIGWDFRSDGDNIIGNYAEIYTIRNGVVYLKPQDNLILPSKYTRVYVVGSTSDVVRRCVIATHPYHGSIVLSQFLNISLDNINTNYTFRLGQHSINRWKVYGEDVYFKGTFIDDKNRNLSDLVTLNQETISTGLLGLRREFGYENLLENPYFISGLDCWLTKNTADYFKANGKFIMTNKTLLSAKRDGAYVIVENDQAVLRLIRGFITQKNQNLKLINNFDKVDPPYYVTLIFNYKPVTSGTLKASIKYKDGSGVTQQSVKAQQDLTPSDRYITWKSTFLWDGKGDFTIEYSGEIKIQTLVLKMDEVRNFEKKYERMFELSDTIVEMAEKYLEQNITT